MRVAYAAAGLTLVADRELYGLLRGRDDGEPDVVITTRAAPAWAFERRAAFYIDPAVDSSGTPHVTVSRATSGFRFEYADETSFWIDARGSGIWMDWTGDFADACAYLVGPVLGFLLRVRGEFALHASAIDLDGAALLFAGPHGAGKSTIAAALARCHHRVLADDIVRLTCERGVWRAHPCSSIVRLWPDGATVACGDVELPRITPSWNKRALTIASGAAGTAVPVGAIVFLAGPSAERIGPMAMTAAQAALALAANTTAGHMLEAAWRAREFEQLTDVAARVPCLSAARPCLEPSALSGFIDRVVAGMRAGAHVRLAV